jgi:hypothetical protein
MIGSSEEKIRNGIEMRTEIQDRGYTKTNCNKQVEVLSPFVSFESLPYWGEGGDANT